MIARGHHLDQVADAVIEALFSPPRDGFSILDDLCKLLI